MKVFLTGGSGFIGSFVLKYLLEESHQVFALSRSGKLHPSTDLKSPFLEVIKGDLLQKESYENALSSCDAVIHIAGKISTAMKDAEMLENANVVSTKNLWQSCEQYKIKKIVYLASIFAHGWAENQVPIEENAIYDDRIYELPMPYFKAKRRAELLSWEYVGKHQLPIIFAYPGYCIGPEDYYLSSMRVVKQFLKNEIPAYVNGGMSFIDVRDAARGLVACLNKGVVGEKYLLSNFNLSWKEFFELLSEVTRKPAPLFILPPGLASFTAKLLESIWEDSPISEGDIALLSHHWYYDSSKARRELGLQKRPLEESLREGIDWMKANRLLD
ncbi:MAG: NAD-dependent epimerase/dehydratase family protein [Leptospiraceae bacterium]|nr:NAD-dependent epimerase/dehydratase family protein [Leptospiraceae bacterium]MCP5501234.1 NAD-dependent epimerase/dehydratase family protein [Leptospiraceae bacterium]